MSTYAEAAAKVAAKVAAYGLPVTLARGTTEVDTYAIRQAIKLGDIDGTLVKAGDQLLLVPAEGLGSFEPGANDRVEIDGKTWAVVSVMPFAPGPLVIQYQLQVRR